MGGPVLWESAPGGPLVYVSAESVRIKSYRFNALTKTLVFATESDKKITTWNHPAAILSLSANNNQGGSAILWAVDLASKNQADGLLASHSAPEIDIPITQVHWL